jgi:hypothetical protein
MTDSTVVTDITVMADITGEKIVRIKPKRLSKSERTHRRRLKQAEHKPGQAGK